MHFGKTAFSEKKMTTGFENRHKHQVKIILRLTEPLNYFETHY